MAKENYERIIMSHEGQEKGPLFFVISGIHGNEKAGIRALNLVSKMLEVEPITNPNFSFHGKLIGITGNLKAVHKNVRYIDKDLNRIWSKENVELIKKKPTSSLVHEEREQLEILDVIEQEVKTYKPTALYILDLHTTSSGGGIFTIPNQESKSLEIAKSLHAPVILGMLAGISGTTLHYFNNNLQWKLPITSVTFEAGQHDDPISINRCIAAIITFLRSIKCVAQEDVENIHDDILINYARNLPLLSKLIYKHEILLGDNFVMRPGYKNFQSIKKGEVLAHDDSGPILSQQDGLILMPLYQSQGEEGFYVIEALNDQLVIK